MLWHARLDSSSFGHRRKGQGSAGEQPEWSGRCDRLPKGDPRSRERTLSLEPFASIRQTPGFGAEPHKRWLAIDACAFNERMKTNSFSTACPSKSSSKPSLRSTMEACRRTLHLSGSGSAGHASMSSEPTGWLEAAVSRWHHRAAITLLRGRKMHRPSCASPSPPASPSTSASLPMNSPVGSASNAPPPTSAIMSESTCPSCYMNHSNVVQNRAADGSARAMAIYSNTTALPTNGGPARSSRFSP